MATFHYDAAVSRKGPSLVPVSTQRLIPAVPNEEQASAAAGAQGLFSECSAFFVRPLRVLFTVLKSPTDHVMHQHLSCSVVPNEKQRDSVDHTVALAKILS